MTSKGTSTSVLRIQSYTHLKLTSILAVILPSCLQNREGSVCGVAKMRVKRVGSCVRVMRESDIQTSLLTTPQTLAFDLEAESASKLEQVFPVQPSTALVRRGPSWHLARDEVDADWLVARPPLFDNVTCLSRDIWHILAWPRCHSTLHLQRHDRMLASLLIQSCESQRNMSIQQPYLQRKASHSVNGDRAIGRGGH